MSDPLHDLLIGTLAPGVYSWRARTRAATLARRATEAGWRCFALDGHQIASKEDFLRACATALCLPGYFGYNWDALEDSLRDLSWAAATRGYLVFYEGAGRFAQAAPDDFAVALSILGDAVEYWWPTATPLAVLLRGLGRRHVAPSLKRL